MEKSFTLIEFLRCLALALAAVFLIAWMYLRFKVRRWFDKRPTGFSPDENQY